MAQHSTKVSCSRLLSTIVLWQVLGVSGGGGLAAGAATLSARPPPLGAGAPGSFDPAVDAAVNLLHATHQPA